MVTKLLSNKSGFFVETRQKRKDREGRVGFGREGEKVVTSSFQTNS